MEAIPQRIIDFLNEHHVLTLATSAGGSPYCANCFYVLDRDHSLVFASEKTTKHIQDALQNKSVAASVVLETKIIGDIRGAQLCGELVELSGEASSLARTIYMTAFPFAELNQTPLWAFQPQFIKLTDNCLGFGNKLIWGTLGG